MVATTVSASSPTALMVGLVAGLLWGARQGVQFSLSLVVLKALPVLIIGGFTSIGGAIAGGLIVGASENLAEVYLGPSIGGGITQKPDAGLRRIAEETGGGYFELRGTTDMNSTFTRVANELHSQYVLGFSPEKLDGKLHKIELRVKQPGLTARTRKSYLASQ